MFCRKCGNEISDSALFCNKCGEKTDKKEISDIPEMTLDDSIVLVDKLKFMYSEIEKMERNVADNESRLKRPINLNYGSYSFFRFFWKYLVFATIAFYGFLIFSLIVSDIDVAFNISLALAVIAPVGLLIAGGVMAVRRRDIENEAIAINNEHEKERRKKLEQETADLKGKLSIKKSDAAKMASFIPENIRNSSSLARLSALLQGGKVSDIGEAIAILRK